MHRIVLYRVILPYLIVKFLIRVEVDPFHFAIFYVELNLILLTCIITHE